MPLFQGFYSLGGVAPIDRGVDWSSLYAQHELQLSANRITRQTREFNFREELDASTDTLPPFIVNNPTREGKTLPVSDVVTMVKEYNSVRGMRDREFQTAEISR